MATSGTIQGTTKNGSGTDVTARYGTWVSWVRNSYSIANNTTNVTISITTQRIDSYSGETAWNLQEKPSVSLTVGGVARTPTVGYIDTRNHRVSTFATWTGDVAHNPNGTLNLGITCSWSLPYVDSLASGYISGTAPLDTIPRYVNITSFSVTAIDETSVRFNYDADAPCDYAWYSIDNGSTWTPMASGVISGLAAGTSYNFKLRLRRTDSQLTTDSNTYKQSTYSYPHCTSSPDFVIGDRLTLGFYNPLGRSVTVTIIGDNGSTVDIYNNLAGTTLSGYNAEQTINNLYKSIPNSQSGKYKVVVSYGNVAMTRNAGNSYRIRGNEAPTINSFDYIDNNATGTVNVTQNAKQIVQKKSMLLARFHAATPNFGAGSITKYTLECNGNKVQGSKEGSYELGTIDSERDVDLILTAVDSRGLSASKTIRVSMLPYSAPGAIVTLKRLNNYEDETYLTVDGSISSVNGKNTMTIQYCYKTLGGNYGSFVTIGDNVKQTLSLNKNQIFIFNVVVTDSFGGRHDKEYTLNKGVFPLFIDTEKNSVGVNKFPVYDKSLEAWGLMSLGERQVLEVASGTSVEIPIYFALCSGLVNFRISGANLEIARLFYVFRTNQYFGAHKALFDESYNNTTTVVPVEIYNADVGYMFKFTNNHSSTIHIRYGIFELC